MAKKNTKRKPVDSHATNNHSHCGPSVWQHHIEEKWPEPITEAQKDVPNAYIVVPTATL